MVLSKSSVLGKIKHIVIYVHYILVKPLIMQHVDFIHKIGIVHGYLVLVKMLTIFVNVIIKHYIYVLELMEN